MGKLKLRAIDDDEPVRVTLELPARLHRDLVACGRILGGEMAIEPAKLVAPMLERFMATDRGFARAKRSHADWPPLCQRYLEKLSTSPSGIRLLKAGPHDRQQIAPADFALEGMSRATGINVEVALPPLWRGG
jgi:hypothetical protein